VCLVDANSGSVSRVSLLLMLFEYFFRFGSCTLTHDICAGMITDLAGGRIAIGSNAVAVSDAVSTGRLLCGRSANGVDSFAVAHNASADAPPSAFSFFNLSNIVAVTAPGATSAANVLLAATDAGTASAVTAGPQMAAFSIGQALSVADFLAGTGLAPRVGLTITIQCEATAPSSAAVVGCAFNNRYCTFTVPVYMLVLRIKFSDDDC
jgi:hypothetical protein